MKVINFALLFILIIIFGVVIPRVVFNDIKVDSKYLTCGHRAADDLLGNPFEALLIVQKKAITSLANNDVHVTAYTFFGLKYAEVLADCSNIDESGSGQQATVLWRLFSNQSVRQER